MRPRLDVSAQPLSLWGEALHATDRDNAVWTHPQANRQIRLQHGGHTVHVGYCCTAASRRSIGMQISAQGLQVRVPRWLSQAQVEATLQARARWIIEKLQQLCRVPSELPEASPAWAPGACVALDGQWLRVTTGLAAPRPLLQRLAQPEPLPPAGAVRRIGAQATAKAHAATAGPEPQVRHVLHLPVPLQTHGPALAQATQQWLREQALLRLQQRCAHFAPLMGVVPTRLSLTNAQTRWGSASSHGGIRLHWRLLQLDPVLFDYVLVHELAHLHEMNHSPRFWAWVGHVQPDYEQHRQRLQQLRLDDWDS